MAHPYAVEMRGIVKRYGSVTANDHIDLSVRKGEVHALLGENGAGKSTLMKILYGLVPKDAGEIALDGQATHIRRPIDAIRAGVGMVHQHFMLVEGLTVSENLIVGMEPTRSLLIDRRAARDRVVQVSTQLGVDVDPDAPIESLSIGQQQRIEIMKALMREAKVLILDEPTAVLTPQETDELFLVMNQLKADGLTIIFITHKLRETFAFADRITVLRGGRLARTLDVRATDANELARLMVGSDLAGAVEILPDTVRADSVRADIVGADIVGADTVPADIVPVDIVPADIVPADIVPADIVPADIVRADTVHADTVSQSRRFMAAVVSDTVRADTVYADTAHADAVHADTVESKPTGSGEVTSPALLIMDRLSVRDRTGRLRLHDVSLSVRAGEILGIAGVEGNGQLELEEAVTGLLEPQSGQVTIDGVQLWPAPEGRGAGAGTHSVPRRRPGTATGPARFRALGGAHIPSDRQRRGLIPTFSVWRNAVLGRLNDRFSTGEFQARASRLIESYDVRTPSIHLPAKALSGGNQQKLIIGRELSASPKVVVAAHPTRGVDIGAVRQIHRELLRMKREGKAILLITADLDELLALSDRIAVLYEGRVVADSPASEMTETKLGLIMTGGTVDKATHRITSDTGRGTAGEAR